jgi:Uma2 family endonuclease
MEENIKEAAVPYQKKIAAEEYLNMEWENGQRYEFWNGELLAMAGGSMNHSEISGNIYASLRPLVKKQSCKIFYNDFALQSLSGNHFFLPDVVITCDKSDFESEKSIKNPSIIVEVLSDSTELYDRSKKWEQYRKIKSLQYYLLVSQNEYSVNMYHRPNESTLFYYQSFSGLDASISFTTMGFELSLKEIYESITLPEK